MLLAYYWPILRIFWWRLVQDRSFLPWVAKGCTCSDTYLTQNADMERFCKVPVLTSFWLPLLDLLSHYYLFFPCVLKVNFFFINLNFEIFPLALVPSFEAINVSMYNVFIEFDYDAFNNISSRNIYGLNFNLDSLKKIHTIIL
jgi:hypothetical protein